MKKSLLLALMSAALCLSGAAADTKLTSATVTEVRNEAKLYVFVGGAEASVRPAKVKDVVTGDRALRTGKASRAELEFNDKSIVRLGANTVFSFQPQTRLLKLEKGTILYQQPKGVGATRIATASATCAITGTTVLIQHLTTASGAQSAVYVVLEGSMVVTINGVAYTVQEGYALVDDGSGKPKIVQVDVAAITRSSALLTAFPELGSIDAIQGTINSQAGQGIASLADVLKDLLGDGTTVNAQDVQIRPGAVPLVIPPPPPPTPHYVPPS
jgi:ferric-dicitrate binding protein FerR (iron transport regulator)